MRTRNLSCPYCNKRTTREKMVNHIDYNHLDQLPEGFTPLRMTFHLANNRPIEYRRPCRVCGNPTEWDEKKGRYNFLCENPLCKEKYIAKMKSSMGDKFGAYRPTATPEGLEKMLAARRISGKYKWSDGIIFTYTGSYELEALKFMDKALEIRSEDLMVPGPVLEYEYEDKKHLYITDMYYRPYDLIIEVKDGGSSINKNKEFAETRAKQMAKEKHIIQNTEYNYIRLTDKDMSQLMAVLGDLKYHLVEHDPDRVIHVNESEIKHSEIFGSRYLEDSDYKFNLNLLDENSNNNILWLSGLTGSGKSTLAKDLYENYNFKYVCLDDISRYYIDKHSEAYINNNVIPNIEKYCIEAMDFCNSNPKSNYNTDIQINETHDIQRDFCNWFIESHKSNGKLYIIEGDILTNLYPLDWFTDKPVIIKHGSYETFCSRRSLREAASLNNYDKLDKSIDLNINNGKLKKLYEYYTDFCDKLKESVDKSIKKTELLESTPLASIVPVVGFNPEKDVVLVNYMKKKTFVDDSDYAIADSPKFDTIYSRDQNGILRKMNKSILLGSYYTPYIVRGRRESIVEALYNNKDKVVDKNFIYETAFGHPMYSSNQIQYEEFAEEYKDYFQGLETIKESVSKYCSSEESTVTNFSESNIELDELDKIIELNESYIIEEVVEPPKNPDIEKVFFVKDKKGNENCCIKLKGYNKSLRGRSELLVIKDNKVFLNMSKAGACSTKDMNYTIPGGGWEKGEKHSKAAIRETEEEARIKTKNIQYVGSYVTMYDEPVHWVKEKIDNPEDWWYGYYTEVFVADYNGIYNKKISEMDKDDNMVNKGKFYDIDYVYDRLHPIHQKAISQYRSFNEASTIYDDLDKITSPEILLHWMKGYLHYTNFTKLKSWNEVWESRSGSCHDFVMFEKHFFDKFAVTLGTRYRTLFCMEYNPGEEMGGRTHSFLYYWDTEDKFGRPLQGSPKYRWFEVAWGSNTGIREYNSVEEMKADIKIKMLAESKYKDVFFTQFPNIKPGATLEELVNRCTSEEEESYIEEDTFNLSFFNDILLSEAGSIISYSKNFTDVKNIVDTFSKEDLSHICNGTFKNSPYVKYREVLLVDKDPAAFIDVYSIPKEMEKDEAVVVCGVKPSYRGNKYINILGERMLKKIKSTGIKKLYWETTKSNIASSTIAKKLGFKKSEDINKDDDNYIYIVEEYLEERSLPKGDVTLYHGSIDGSFNTILPNSINNGKRWEPARFSSFWFLKKEYAIMFATAELLQKESDGKIYILIDNDMKTLVPEKYKNEAENIIRTKHSFVYSTVVDGKYVTGGNGRNFPEYTLEFPVTPKEVYSNTYSDMKKSIKYCTDEYLESVIQRYKNNTMTYGNSLISQMIDNIMYGTHQDIINNKKAIKKSFLKESSSDTEISKPYFIRSTDGVDNACVNIRNYSKPFRARSSMLILKKMGNRYYVYLRKNKGDEIRRNGKYSAPGGGWNKNETPMDAAIREAEEEARILVSNVKFCGELFEYHEDVAKWVKDNVPNPSDWWYGYYSRIYVGMYKGKYNGHIDERDKEQEFIDDANFYPFEDVMDEIVAPYKDAINKYISGEFLKEEFTEEDLERNKTLNPVFVVNVFTGTPVGKAIRAASDSKYSHTLISLTSKLTPMYSFDEKEIYDVNNINNMTKYKGLIIDNFERYKKDLSNGNMRVICIMVTDDTMDKIKEGIKYYLDRIDKTKYSYTKLAKYIVGSKQANSFGDMAMVCSEFVDSILKFANIDISGKSSSNTKPDDIASFRERNNFFQVYEGKIFKYNPNKVDSMIEKFRHTIEYKDLVSQTSKSMKNPFDHELGKQSLIPGMVKRAGNAIKKKVLREDGTFEWVDDIEETTENKENNNEQ